VSPRAGPRLTAGRVCSPGKRADCSGLAAQHDLDAEPFTAAGCSPALTAAYDELIGPGRWKSPVDVGRAVMVRAVPAHRRRTGRRADPAGARLASDRRAVPGPYGEAGTDADSDLWYPSTLCRPVAHATGTAGDVYLCHPFIVHTATWPHHGTGPRMIAQPAVNAPAGFTLDGTDPSPVAQAIANGLAMAD
jgi:hypothetical protein